jgi:hypothetical protein
MRAWLVRKRFKSWHHVVQRWGSDLLALPNEGTVVIKPNRHVPTRLAGLPSTIMSSIPPPEMTNKPASPSTLSKGEESTIPIDADIPDNYVSWTLKNQKALPPFQWNKILAELNWLNVSILTIPPLLTVYAILCVPLQTKTFFFSIFYYFVTGLGELPPTPCSVVRLSDSAHRYYSWLPSSMGPPGIQRLEASPVRFGYGRCRCCRGID